MSQTPGSLPSPSAVFCPILEPRKKRTEAREGIIRVAGGGYGLVTGQARSADGCAAPFIGWLRRGQGRWSLIGWTRGPGVDRRTSCVGSSSPMGPWFSR